MLLRDTKRWAGETRGCVGERKWESGDPFPISSPLCPSYLPMSSHPLPTPLSARPACDVCDTCPPRACTCVGRNICDKVRTVKASTVTTTHRPEGRAPSHLNAIVYLTCTCTHAWPYAFMCVHTSVFGWLSYRCSWITHKPALTSLIDGGLWVWVQPGPPCGCLSPSHLTTNSF